MKKHALPIFIALMLSIILASSLGYFPSHPSLENNKVLSSEEFTDIWFDADKYTYYKVDFLAEALNITSEIYADYILAYAYPESLGKKELVIMVSCQYPKLNNGDNIYVQGYVKGGLYRKDSQGQVWSTPLIVGTSIDLIDTEAMPAAK